MTIALATPVHNAIPVMVGKLNSVASFAVGNMEIRIAMTVIRGIFEEE